LRLEHRGWKRRPWRRRRRGRWERVFVRYGWSLVEQRILVRERGLFLRKRVVFGGWVVLGRIFVGRGVFVGEQQQRLFERHRA
jgi:hypothetical protein